MCALIADLGAERRAPSTPENLARDAASNPEAFERRLRMAAQLCQDMESVPLLSLAAGLFAFRLHTRQDVSVHLINLDVLSRSAFEKGAFMRKMGDLQYPSMRVQYCGLTAPDLTASIEQALEGSSWLRLKKQSKRMSCERFTVELGLHWGLWHESADDLPPPDLVMGFNINVRDVGYEWPETLRALVAQNVPCVFTAASERAYERALTAVRAAGASVAFHGRAPRPGQLPMHKHGELQHLNAYWVAFCGGQA